MTHILLAEEQTTKKSKYMNIDKTEIRENKSSQKSTGSQFVKVNPREMLKKMTREN